MQWFMRALGSICLDIKQGFAGQPSKAHGAIPHLRTNNISPEGRIDLSSVKSVLATRSQVKTYALKPGDILFNNTNSASLVGKTAYFDEPGLLLFSNHLTRIRVDNSLILPRFLAIYIHMKWKQGVFRNSITQWVNQAAISQAQLKQLPVALPPVSEQRRIIEILDQADRLRKLRSEADSTAERILPSLFLEFFGDPIENPKGWGTVPFGQAGILERGVSRHRPRNDPSLLGGPYPFIQTGEVTNCGGRIYSYTYTYSELGLQQSRLWSAGTLCITIAANIAQTGILELDACFPDSVVGFLPHDRGTTEFIQAWLGFLQPTIEAKAPGFAQKNINLALLRELPVILPPRKLRERFSEQARILQFQRRLRSRAAELLSDLFTALLHRAFTGDLTASWREAHMNELLQEMEHEEKALASPEAIR